MGTIKDDSCLDKLRDIARREVRGCVYCQQTEGAPAHGTGKGQHAYLDPASEPIFVLRAQDKTAYRTLIAWIEMNRETLPQEKLEEAAECLLAMLQWPRQKTAD